MLADVAGGTDEPLTLQRGVEDRAVLGLLLGKRGVAREAQPGRLGVRPPQVGQLAGYAGPHAPGVKTGLPLRELRGVARSAAFRGE
jgi:hypothetical protein